jgi:hypothetical protein
VPTLSLYPQTSTCPAACPNAASIPLLTTPSSCLLLDVPRRSLEAGVALLVRPPRTEPGTDEGGERPPLEEQDGEDDAEAEAEGGLDDQVGEAAVPL